MIGAGEVLTEYLFACHLREVPVCGSRGNMGVMKVAACDDIYGGGDLNANWGGGDEVNELIVGRLQWHICFCLEQW